MIDNRSKIRGKLVPYFLKKILFPVIFLWFLYSYFYVIEDDKRIKAKCESQYIAKKVKARYGINSEQYQIGLKDCLELYGHFFGSRINGRFYTGDEP